MKQEGKQLTYISANAQIARHTHIAICIFKVFQKRDYEGIREGRFGGLRVGKGAAMIDGDFLYVIC